VVFRTELTEHRKDSCATQSRCVKCFQGAADPKLPVANGSFRARWRSAATAMIALGFAATFLSVASGLFATYKTHAVLSELTSAPPAQRDTFFIVAHCHRFSLLGVLGMWVAAAGTLWHVRLHR